MIALAALTSSATAAFSVDASFVSAGLADLSLAVASPVTLSAGVAFSASCSDAILAWAGVC